MRRNDSLAERLMGRVTDVERRALDSDRLRSVAERGDLRIMPFAFGNKTTAPAVVGSVDYPFEDDGTIVGLFASLKTAGATATTFAVYLEDTTLVGSGSLGSGVRKLEVGVTHRWVARLEGVEARCTAAGTGALGLAVAVLWIPNTGVAV